MADFKQHDSGSGLPASKAVRLGGMVDYADGSIVSRALIQSEVGTVTLFAFDKGQGLSEHSAPFDAVVQVLDGRAMITIGGQETAVGAGETILMPADIPHAVAAPQRFKMLLVMIRG